MTHRPALLPMPPATHVSANAWAEVLSTRTTDASKVTTTSAGHQLARDLFEGAGIARARNDTRPDPSLRAECAPWEVITGLGPIESLDCTVHPLSVYRSQLQERLDRHTRGDLFKAGEPKALGRDAVNARLTLLRSIVRALALNGSMSTDDAERIASRLRTLKDQSTGLEPSKPIVTTDQIQAAMDSIASDIATGNLPNSARLNGAIIALLITGARPIEVCRARWEDLRDIDGPSIILRGKGSKLRLAHLASGQATALDEWRSACGSPSVGPIVRRVLRGDGVSVTGDAPELEHVHTRSIGMRIQKLMGAEVDLGGLMAFRRWRVTTDLDRGIPLEDVARMAGHSSADTTVVYAVTDEKKSAAAARSVAVGMFAPRRKAQPELPRDPDGAR